VSHLADKG